MEPEAVPDGLVAGRDRGILGQAESLLGGRDLGQERVGVTGRDRPEPGLLALAGSESQLPGLLARLQGEIEHRGGGDGRDS
jgi:hypothetical protein